MCFTFTSKAIFSRKHIRLGENFAHSVVDCEDDVCADPVQDIGVEKKIVHSEFNKNYFNNDIALVKLKRAAIYNGEGLVSFRCIRYEIEMFHLYRFYFIRF